MEQEGRRIGDRRRRELPALAGAIVAVLIVLIVLCAFNVVVRHTLGAWLLLAGVSAVAASCVDVVFFDERGYAWIRDHVRRSDGKKTPGRR